MSFSEDTIIQKSENVLSSALGSESVILDHEQGLYFGLEEVGSFVWEKIQEDNYTVAQLKEAVLAEYEIDEATAEKDLQGFLTQLHQEKLIN